MVYSLSPLLFCLAINPISELIANSRHGYSIKSKFGICSIYMDDLKLFAKNEKDLTPLISTVQLFSSDACINLSKSACLIVSRGKITETTGVNIKAFGLVSDVDGYKYLDIVQDLLISHQIVKDNVISEYRSRLRSVLSSQLNGHNKIILMILQC